MAACFRWYAVGRAGALVVYRKGLGSHHSGEEENQSHHSLGPIPKWYFLVGALYYFYIADCPPVSPAPYSALDVFSFGFRLHFSGLNVFLFTLDVERGKCFSQNSLMEFYIVPAPPPDQLFPFSLLHLRSHTCFLYYITVIQLQYS